MIVSRACALALAGAFASAIAPIPSRAADRIAITVAVTRSADAVPLFYAIKAGLFEKAGLDVHADGMASGGAISSAVVGRAADIGFSNVQTLIMAHERKVAFAIVAPGGQYNDTKPTTALLVNGDSTIKTAKDLEGATVAVGSLNDLQSLSVTAWMSANGADPTKVHFIESPTSAAPALLQQKRADAIVVSEPNFGYARANGARVLAPTYSSLAKRFVVSVFFSTDAWAKANPEAVARFGEVIHRAADYVNAHPAEMDEIIRDYAKIPLDVLRTMTHARQLGVVTPADVQPIIDAAARFHVIEKPFPAKDIIAAP